MVFKTDQDKELRMPSFAFCPAKGFKHVEALGLDKNFWSQPKLGKGNWTKLESSSEFQILFDRSTYTKEDSVISAIYYEGATNSFFNMTQSSSPDVVLAEVPSEVYGKCLVFTIKKITSNIADYAFIQLNIFETIEKWQVYVFEAGHEIFGIGLNYWIGAFKSFEMRRGEQLSLGMVKRRRLLRAKTHKCDEKGDSGTYTSCIYDQVHYSWKVICFVKDL